MAVSVTCSVSWYVTGYSRGVVTRGVQGNDKNEELKRGDVEKRRRSE